MRFPRLHALLTGVVEWVDPETGQITAELYGWRDRWSIFGFHSYNWRWVRRWGKLECGCTRNPLTRRIVLIAPGCSAHGLSEWMELGDDD